MTGCPGPGQERLCRPRVSSVQAIFEGASRHNPDLIERKIPFIEYDPMNIYLFEIFVDKRLESLNVS